MYLQINNACIPHLINIRALVIHTDANSKWCKSQKKRAELQGARQKTHHAYSVLFLDVIDA